MIIEMKVPEVGESINEVTLAQWLVEDGSYVEMDQPVVEMETDKASQELFAEKSGKIEFVAEEGDDLGIGALICKIDTSAEAPANAQPAADEKPKQSEEKVEKEKVSTPEKSPAKEAGFASGHPSPAAGKILAEANVSAAQVSGTGRGGRITKSDALAAASNGSANGLPTALGTFSREEKQERLSRLRKTIARRLVFAKNSTAMLTTFNEVDCSAMMAVRSQFKEQFKETHGVGLGFMSFFSKACCLALQKYPAVNAYFDEDHLIYHDFVDISIAVSTPKGLVVPVIRNAESLTMAQTEAKIKELAIKGRDGNLSMDEMTGGTFTISNGGVFGSLMSTPILNPPQSAILGMHKIEQRPIAIDGKVEIRPMMYLALSYDHRIIDGKESVSFLVAVKEYLENPSYMLAGKNPEQLLLDL